MSHRSARPIVPTMALGAVAALACLVAPCAKAAAPEEAVIGTFRLPGGLEVVTSEDHAAPWAVIDTFVAAGSSQDFTGYQGVAAGTAYATWFGSRQAPQDSVAAAGGTSQVFVDRSVTHFQARVPAAKVADALAAIGDAFSHPDWTALNIARTNDAFSIAAARTSSDPLEPAFQLFYESAYDRDLAHPVFGPAGTRMDRSEVQAFFERHYVPGKMKVVLTGDFNTGKAVGQVVRGYAAVLQRQPSMGNLPSRPEAAGGHMVWHPATPHVILAARGPEIGTQREQAAMALLTKVLGAPVGRLDRALAAVGGGHVETVTWRRSAGAGVFLANITADGGSPEAIRQALVALIAELRANPISLDEHAKAMAAAIAAEDATLAAPPTRAIALGYATVGAQDPYWVRTYPEELRQVSRQDIMAVVQKYMAPTDLRAFVAGP